MNWVWVLIPLAALSIPIIAILSSVVEKIIKAQQQQEKVMAEEYMAEITAQLAASEEDRERLKQRIINLEAIVSANPAQDNQARALPEVNQQQVMPDLEKLKQKNNEEKVASLARELNG